MRGIGFVTDYVTSIQQAFTEHLVTMLWAGHQRNRDKHTPMIKYGMELSILTEHTATKLIGGTAIAVAAGHTEGVTLQLTYILKVEHQFASWVKGREERSEWREQHKARD